MSADGGHTVCSDRAGRRWVGRLRLFCVSIRVVMPVFPMDLHGSLTAACAGSAQRSS
ncbi:MAG: hypothetical protein NNA23_07330 [Nitrospira sp.]|nr:hypothetical protein [Nitrospira sp.]